jgi:putative ABC transport system permease protein
MTTFIDILRLAVESLSDRKTRTTLTILMVAAGCSLMIALKGTTAGFSGFITVQFSKLAPNILFVSGATDSNNTEYFATQGTNSKSILNDAVVKRISTLTSVADVIPFYQGVVAIQSRGSTIDATVFSIDPSKLPIISPTMTLVTGSAIRPNDPSAVLLPKRLAEPPGNSVFASVGQAIQITYKTVSADSGKPIVHSRSFIVSGIINDTGDPNIDNGVLFNHAASTRLLQKSGRFDGVIVAAQAADSVAAVEAQLKELYGKQLGISTPRSILETLNEFIEAFGSFTDSTSVIALVVGGIGIITTLYTSVTERTREIGTIKALGADNAFVLTMFLSEAILIGIAGATCGAGLGIVGGHVLMSRFSEGRPDLVPVFRNEDLMYVWLTTVSLSLAAGLYPAWRATRISPMTALRRD